MKRLWMTTLLWFPALAWAGNVVMENEMRSEGFMARSHGEKIRIQAANLDFTAVLDEARGQAIEGGAILLPEAGHGPASQAVTGIFRDYLPDHGWTTLSIQLPVLEPRARPLEYWSLLPEASKRLAAAVNWWQQKGIENIALIGYGWGSLVASSYLAGEPDKAVRAVALISIGWPAERSRAMKVMLAKIKVPVLDIWAQRDHPEVLATKGDRQLILKGNQNYRRLAVSATGHAYRARREFLAKRILGWLRRVAPGKALGGSF